MRSSVRDLVVRFRGDAKDFERATGQATKATQQLGDGAEKGSAKGKKGFGVLGGAAKGLTKLFGPLLAMVTAFSAVDWFKGAIEGASNLEQSRGGVEAVFKKQADVIMESAKGAAAAFGLTENSYNELALLIGSGLKNKGIEDFAGQTQDLVALGGDLAAMYGGTAKEAVEAIGSLMRGEANPIEKYGVGINETAIAAELAATGQNKLTGAALETAKTQARLNILFRQTKDAQGAAAREADTYASQQAKFNAQLENLQARVGETLLPIVNGLMTAFNDHLMPALEGAADKFSEVWTAIEEGQGLPKIVEILGLDEKIDTAWLQDILEPWEEVIDRFKDPALQGIAAWWTDTMQPAIESFASALDDRWNNGIKPILTDLNDMFADLLVEHADEIEAAATAIGEIIASLMAIAETVTRNATEKMSAFWDKWGWLIEDVARSLFDKLVKIFGGQLRALSGLVDAVLGIMQGDWSKFGDGLKRYALGMLDSLLGIFGLKTSDLTAMFQRWGERISSWASRTWTSIKNRIVNPIIDARDAIGRALDKAGGFFSGLADTAGTQLRRLKEAAKDPINFVINTVYNNGLRTAFNAIAKTLGSKTRLESVPGLRGGGILQGYRPYAAGDDQIVKMRSGEGVYVSEAMRDPYERKRLLEVNRRALRGQSLDDLQGLAGGGWVAPVNAGHSGWNGGRYRSGAWHGGLDYPVPTGTPVVAPTAAKVLSKQWLATSYGIHAQLQSLEGGYRIILAHLSKMPSFPGAGATIPQGYLVGLSGSTGNSTGPHLHFEVQPPGRGHMGAVNPEFLLSGKKPKVGGDFHNKIESFDPISALTDAFAGPLRKLDQLDNSPIASLAKAWPSLVVTKAKDAAKDMLGLGGFGRIPAITRDRGGPLPTGPSLVYNGTGRAEHVVTGNQWDQLVRGGGRQINFYGPVGKGAGEDVAKEIEKRERRSAALRARV